MVLLVLPACTILHPKLETAHCTGAMMAPAWFSGRDRRCIWGHLRDMPLLVWLRRRDAGKGLRICSGAPTKSSGLLEIVSNGSKTCSHRSEAEVRSRGGSSEVKGSSINFSEVKGSSIDGCVFFQDQELGTKERKRKQ